VRSSSQLVSCVCGKMPSGELTEAGCACLAEKVPNCCRVARLRALRPDVPAVCVLT
jgi:hypothetical protein